MDNKKLKVHGSLLKGFAEACVNLKIVAGIQSKELVYNINPIHWYPLSHFQKLQQSVLQSYDDSEIILETIGTAMMQGWYEFGSGKNLIEDGIGFLYFQGGSDGYVSVLQGPKEVLGTFELTSLDRENGKAVIHSSTPFERNMERGIIIGGMLAPGDISYVDVDNSEDPNVYQVRFRKAQTSPKEWEQFQPADEKKRYAHPNGPNTEDLWWHYKGLQKKWDRAVAFWQATNNNLLKAYEKLDKQRDEVGQVFYKAGMADATIDVIHNIGNSINNVMTAAELAKRILQNSKIEEMTHVSDLLDKHSNHLVEFLTRDEKGTKIIEYLKILGASLIEDVAKCQNEVNHIREGVFNVGNILNAQRTYLETENILENFNVIAIIEGALRSQSGYLRQHSVQVIKLFSENDILAVIGHQSKLISVLLELIKNAVEAMLLNQTNKRMLTISPSRSKNHVVIEINDNGEGIHKDHFKTIFSHGYTTRKNRYGFGLHNCANYINEMGGKIRVVQSSPENGTTFGIKLKPA